MIPKTLIMENNEPSYYTLKLFTAGSALYTAKHFQPSLIFVIIARACMSGPTKGRPL
jgi:hypothetical protein